jgi:hypothetical protein
MGELLVSHWPVLFGEGGGFSAKVFLVCIWVFFFGVEDVEDSKISILLHTECRDLSNCETGFPKDCAR